MKWSEAFTEASLAIPTPQHHHPHSTDLSLTLRACLISLQLHRVYSISALVLILSAHSCVCFSSRNSTDAVSQLSLELKSCAVAHLLRRPSLIAASTSCDMDSMASQGHPDTVELVFPFLRLAAILQVVLISLAASKPWVHRVSDSHSGRLEELGSHVKQSSITNTPDRMAACRLWSKSKCRLLPTCHDNPAQTTSGNSTSKRQRLCKSPSARPAARCDTRPGKQQQHSPPSESGTSWASDRISSSLDRSDVSPSLGRSTSSSRGCAFCQSIAERFSLKGEVEER